MEAVIVTDADAGTGLGGGLLDGPKLGGVEGAGLFDQHVFTGLDGGEGNGREGRVERGDDDGIDRGIGEHGVVVRRGCAARNELGEAGGAGGVEVAGGAEGNAGDFTEGLGAFAADQAAADDGEAGGTGRGDIGRRH